MSKSTNQLGTTIEQSAELVCLGINPATAPMEWIQVCHGLMSNWKWELHVRQKSSMRDRLSKPKHPSWSLHDLGRFLPPTIINARGKTSHLIWNSLPISEDKMMSFGYIEIPQDPFHPIGPDVICETDSDPYGAVINLMKWLVDNGYELNLNNTNE